MSTAAITIRIDPETKAKAEQYAKEKGLNLNVVIKQYLQQFVKTKKNTLEEVPNAYFKNQLKKARENRKAGKGSSIFTSNKLLIKQNPKRYMHIDAMEHWLEQQGI